MLEKTKKLSLAEINTNNLNNKEIREGLDKYIKLAQNYVIKEIENVRDTEIVVDFDKEIKTEILQDQNKIKIFIIDTYIFLFLCNSPYLNFKLLILKYMYICLVVFLIYFTFKK